MNAAPSEQTVTELQPVSRSIKFVLASFLFFFFVMGAVSLGDLVRALFR